MKKQIALSTATFLCVAFLALDVSASKFKGYDRKPSAAEMTMTEPVDRFTETDKEFLILFVHHPAFYRLPKVAAYTDQVRTFLQDSVRSKKIVSAQINPVTTEILYIGSDK